GDPDDAVGIDVGALRIGELAEPGAGAALDHDPVRGQVSGEVLDPVAPGVDRPHGVVGRGRHHLGPGEGARLGPPGADLRDVGAVGLEALDPVVEPVHHVDLAVRGDVDAVRLGDPGGLGLEALDLAQRGALRGEDLDAGAPEVGAVD